VLTKNSALEINMQERSATRPMTQAATRLARAAVAIAMVIGVPIWPNPLAFAA
jgi:hypothetical protein